MTYHHGNLRSALLDRAATVIAEEGIEALSLRALARDLGVSHAAPGRHFKDRADLLAALAAEGHRRMTAALNTAATAAGDDPVARYNALGREVIAFSLRHPAYFQVTQHPEVERHSDPSLMAARQAFGDTVRAAAAAAQAVGWRPDEDLEALQLFSTAAALGAASVLMRQSKFAGRPTAELLAIAGRVIDLVIPPSLEALRQES
ncbi:MAG: TetR family transcriptional regulator [Pseudomonadota bacterium]